MKQILLKTSLFSIALFASISAAKAQDIIIEQDGANEEFVISQWDFSSAFSFASKEKITIEENESGTLTIDNSSNEYKSIEVELRFNFPLNNSTATFDLAIKEPGDVLKETTNYIDATTGNEYAYTIVKYQNSTGFKINEMVLSNPSKSLNINYIKISGEKTSGLSTEELNAFDMAISSENIMIDSKMDGTLNIYNTLGETINTYSIKKGENKISNATQGLMFLVLSNTDGEVVTRKKALR